MPAISACPRCQKLVSLPSDVDSAAQVRCPLCHSEYALGEAIPPELIPVVAVTTDEAELAAVTQGFRYRDKIDFGFVKFFFDVIKPMGLDDGCDHFHDASD